MADEAPSPLAEALALAAGHFRRAAAGEPFGVLEAITGLRMLVQAAMVADGRSAPACAEDVVAAICSATPIVARASGIQIPPDAVLLGMAAASNFANIFRLTPDEHAGRTDPQLAADWLDHVLLLADDLDAGCRRRAIGARGDVFRRAIAIRRALDAGADGARIQ